MNKAIILFHGFSSTPDTVKSLKEKLEIFFQESVEVITPPLYGHGLNPERKDVYDLFGNSKKKQWLQSARDVIIKTKKEKEIIAIGGISMGSLIATHMAKEFNIKKVLMFSPAFTNKQKAIYLTPLLGLFKIGFKKKEMNYPSENGEYSDYHLMVSQKAYQLYKWIRPAAQLLFLQWSASRVLKKLKECNFFVYYSKEDPIVGKSSIELIKRKSFNSNLITFNEYEVGLHEILNDKRIKNVVCEDVVIQAFR